MTSCLTTAISFFLISSVIRLVQQGLNKKTFAIILKRGITYLAYLAVAARLDTMGINNLLGWTGSSQFLVAIWVAAIEIKDIFKYVRTLSDIGGPPIMDGRLEQMEQGQVNPKTGYIDPISIDEQIIGLKDNLDKLHKVAELKNQIYSINSQLSGAGYTGYSAPPYKPYVPPAGNTGNTGSAGNTGDPDISKPTI